jgi:HisJ family histidinol phosphate phosphatase
MNTDKNVVWRRDDNEKIVYLSKARRLPDMHIHTYHCNHADNRLQDIVDHLLKFNFWGAISEHAPFPSDCASPVILEAAGIKENEMRKYLRICQMQHEQVGSFIGDIKAVKRQELLPEGYLPIGLEMDFFPGYEDKSRKVAEDIGDMLKKAGSFLNHLGGVVHYVNGIAPFHWQLMNRLIKEIPPEQMIKDYFKTECKAVESKMFDLIFHPGIIHFLINRSSETIRVMQDEKLKKAYLDGYKELVCLAAEYGTCLEINMSALDREFFNYNMPPEMQNPDKLHPHMPYEIIKFAVEKGVMFTVGSDWHHSNKICTNSGMALDAHRYFDQAYDALKQLGVKEVYKIVRRQKVAVGL